MHSPSATRRRRSARPTRSSDCRPHTARAFVSTFAEYRSWLVVQAATGFGAANVAGKLFADLGCTVAAVTFDGDPDETDACEREVDGLLSRSKHSVALASSGADAAAALDAMLRSAEI